MMKNLLKAFQSESAASTPDEESSPMGDLSYIEANEIEDWEMEHVIDYFQHFGLSDEVNLAIVQKIKEIGMDEIQHTDFKKYFGKVVTSKEDQDVMWKAVEVVRDHRKLDLTFANLFVKILNLHRRINQKIDVDSMEKMAKNLCERNTFHQKYFQFFVDFVGIKSLEVELSSDEKNKKLLKKKEGAEKLALEKFKKISGGSTSEEMHAFGNKCLFFDKEIVKVPVKLCICEDFIEGEGIKDCVRYSSKSKSYRFLAGKFGKFRCGICVGPWYLQWEENELILPKKPFDSSREVVCVDSPTLTSLELTYEEFPKIMRKLSKLCHQWNDKKRFTGNSQAFVDAVLATLYSRTMYKNDPFSQFCVAMNISGSLEMSFSPSPKLCEMYALEEGEMTFGTHKELDEFVGRLYEKGSSGWYYGAEGDRNLLLAFDRAFWLRHMKDPKNEQFKPAENCVLGDPRIRMVHD